MRAIQILLLALALPLIARAAAVLPADSNAGQMPNIAVWDEANIQSSLWAKLSASGSGPVFVLPLYTHCTMSCPVLATRLARESAKLPAGARFRVLIFSFDPADDAAALRDFRRQEQLPASWILVRSTPSDIRRFCDFFHYNILTEGPVMIHANQIFLLDHTLQWRATFIDEKWDAADLALWMKRAEAPGLLGWFAMNPEKLAFIGLGGMLLSLALIFWALLSRTRLAQQPTPTS